MEPRLLNIYRGDAATALAHAQAVLSIAERSGDDELIGRILNTMGTANNALGRPALARVLLNTALRIFERRDDHALQADCLSLRANALLLLCDVDGALASARAALALAERDCNLWGQAQST
jgi:tetratricopeptide (TPR) repeat protein